MLRGGVHGPEGPRTNAGEGDSVRSGVRLSLRFKIVAAIVGVVLGCVALQGWFAYRSAREIIVDEAVKAVGMSAEARRQALGHELRRKHERVELHAEQLTEACAAGSADLCSERLGVIVSLDREMVGARVDVEGTGPVRAGDWVEETLRFPEGQLARFPSGEPAPAHYVVEAGHGDGLVLSARFRTDRINAIFLNRQGLGKSGEAFLTDDRGMFLTPPRYGTDLVHSHLIEARPMERCLRREDSEALDADYRGVGVIHGFRHVPEIGGGCIMVHMDQSEAFAPAAAFGRTLFLLSLGAFGLGGIVLSLFLGRALTRPLQSLSRTASRITEGEVEARAPVGSADEVGVLAHAFNTMVERLTKRTEELAGANRELEAANEELEAFSYSVSHDLRQPLRGIDGFSRALLRSSGSPDDPEVRHLLSEIQTNTRRMDRLIDDLLAYSRQTQGEMRLVPVEMTELASAAIQELRLEIGRRDVRIDLEPLPRAVADPTMVRQVFTNLLSNAVKYTDGRDPAVIEVGHTSGPHGPVYHVRDNGVGFDMKYAGRLFGIFQRLHSSDDFEGTGVGLAIVRRIVRRHGGRVWAESVPDRGTTILFHLSREPTSTSSHAPRP